MMDANIEKLLLFQGLENNSSIIIPEKFKNYNIVISPSEYQTVLPFKIDNTPSNNCQSSSDGFLNSENNNNSSHSAIHYCRSLDIGGFTDWYLPSKEEMEFISENDFIYQFDYELLDIYYWTSTEYSMDTILAWMLDVTDNTGAYTDFKSEAHQVVPIKRVYL